MKKNYTENHRPRKRVALENRKCQVCGRKQVPEQESMDCLNRIFICCWCGALQEADPRSNDNSYTSRGRPSHEEPVYTEKTRLLRDSELLPHNPEIPAWFEEALQENKWLSVHEFARKFGTHPTQVRRWCQMGLIHTAWTCHSYTTNQNLLCKHYTFRRLPQDGNTHRRIPASELERCKFLKSRIRGCGRDPRFKIVEGERTLGPDLAPAVPKWHDTTPPSEAALAQQQARDENFIKAHPGWEKLSEDDKERLRQATVILKDNVSVIRWNQAVAGLPDVDAVDLSIFEEKE